MFPQLARFTDIRYLLRLMVGLVSITRDYRHLKNPEARSKSIGMSKSFRISLGVAEVAGSFGLAFGVYATRRIRTDPAHARCDPEENLLVVHVILGRESLRLALRLDARRDEPGGRLLGRRMYVVLE
ncbi:MAG TPA: hypothetical protein VMP68_07980 [Candidatus Eisenbacteria bacterium]|nr:hypothetical protein [Candidatus Eisenbacteria bacterium]